MEVAPAVEDRECAPQRQETKSWLSCKLWRSFPTTANFTASFLYCSFSTFNTLQRLSNHGAFALFVWSHQEIGARTMIDLTLWTSSDRELQRSCSWHFLVKFCFFVATSNHHPSGMLLPSICMLDSILSLMRTFICYSGTSYVRSCFRAASMI